MPLGIVKVRVKSNLFTNGHDCWLVSQLRKFAINVRSKLN
jgi:hypothetical protein